MTELPPSIGGSTPVLVRRGLVSLTVIGILATAFELATVKHWHNVQQLIPWASLLVLAVAVLLVLLPGRRHRIAARILVFAVLGASVYGVIDHTVVNYNSGPLDYRFADSWDTLLPTQRWWYAFTRTVGPAPTLAPAILGQTALLLALASLIERRPADRTSRAKKFQSSSSVMTASPITCEEPDPEKKSWISSPTWSLGQEPR